jgi:hypothetical protein
MASAPIAKCGNCNRTDLGGNQCQAAETQRFSTTNLFHTSGPSVADAGHRRDRFDVEERPRLHEPSVLQLEILQAERWLQAAVG